MFAVAAGYAFDKLTFPPLVMLSDKDLFPVNLGLYVRHDGRRRKVGPAT